MKRALLSLVLIVLVIGLVAGCAQPAPAPTPTPAPAPTPTPAPAPAEPILLKFASHNPPMGTAEIWYVEEWEPKIKELTGGQVEIDFYFSETLGKTLDQWRMLVAGVCDIAFICPPYYPGSFPMSECGDVPELLPCSEHVPCTCVANELFDKFLYPEWSEARKLWIYVTTPGFSIQTTNKAVRTIDDFKGMQMGCPTGVVGRSVEALGATQVIVPVPEAYVALERGMIDGYAMPTSSFMTFKWYEPTNYHTFLDIGCAIMVYAMNLETWNMLPADVQKVFDDTRPWVEESLIEIRISDVEKALQVYREAGLEIISLPPEDEAKRKELQKVIRDEWIEEMKGKGLPGQEIWDEAQRLKAAGCK